jgi:hypothetical protein
LSAKGSIKTAADFVITFVLYLLLSLGAHEMFHAEIARMLGYNATVSFPSWSSGYTVISPLPSSLLHKFLISVAGGGLVALFYFLIGLFTRDWETSLIMKFFVPWQGIYALFEFGYMLGYVPINLLGTVPFVLGAIIGFYFLGRSKRKSQPV